MTDGITNKPQEASFAVGASLQEKLQSSVATAAKNDEHRQNHSGQLEQEFSFLNTQSIQNWLA